MRDDDPLKYFPGYAEACARAEANNLVPEPGGEVESSLLRRLVRELGESWERRLRARNCISWNDHDAGKGEQLQECLDELRAEIAKLPNQ